MDEAKLKQLSYKIFECFDTEDYAKAKRLLKKELENHPEEYWIVTNLAIVYYESGDFKKALEYSNKAMEMAPNDPLVLNYHAPILRVNDRFQEAIDTWMKVMNMSEEELANSRFGEGVKWAKSLVNDIRYNLGNAYSLLDDYATAVKYYQEHLSNRKRGMYSIYSKAEVQQELDEALWMLEDKE